MSLRSGLVSSKVPLLVRHYHRCRCVVVLSGSDTAVGPCRVVARAVRDPVTSRSVGSCYMTRAAQLLPSSDRPFNCVRSRPVDVPIRRGTPRMLRLTTGYVPRPALPDPAGPPPLYRWTPRTTRVPRRPARRAMHLRSGHTPPLEPSPCGARLCGDADPQTRDADSRQRVCGSALELTQRGTRASRTAVGDFSCAFFTRAQPPTPLTGLGIEWLTQRGVVYYFSCL